MGESVSVIDSHSFHRRIATASHAAILMTVFVLSMITSFSNVEDGVAMCLTALQEEGLLPSTTREEK